MESIEMDQLRINGYQLMEASRSKFEAWAQGTSVCEHCDKHRLELSTGVVVGFCYHKAADLCVRQAAHSLPCDSCIQYCSAIAVCPSTLVKPFARDYRSAFLTALHGVWSLTPTPPPTRTELKFGKRVWSGWFRTAQELIPDRDEDRRKACPIFKAGARGYQLGLKGASWLPEMWQRVADLFQDDRYGSRLLPFLDIEIRRIIPAHDVVHDEGQWLRHVCLCFEPRPEGVPDPDYRRLHQHLFHSDAYAYIVVMTSQGPYPFLLRACEGKNNNWRMIAGKVPVLRGDPCVHCPGWGQAWDAKHRRPYWFHWAHGPTWVRPVGWRGTDYPFPIIVLRHHFCDRW